MTVNSLSALIHGVVAAATVPLISDLDDVFGLGSVQVHVKDDLALIASRVPGDIDLTALFADQNRVAKVALAHHQILAEICTSVDVVPIRLGGVISGEQTAQELIRKDGDRFRETLRKIAGAVEFSVILNDGAPRPVAAPKPSDGRSYLRGRSAVASQVHLRPLRIEAAMAAVDALLREGTRSQQARPLPHAEQGGQQRRFDTTYLVDRDNTTEFLRRCSTLPALLADANLVSAVRGPWPSYSLAGELETTS
ncbi:MAG: GvpL/GvpF family gas vesicle protein [Tardiphaga sp.]|nr:GvpL/GvpF family gas vesicle protein [Tardiphaga sp.]